MDVAHRDKSIESHLERIYDKLDAHSRAAMSDVSMLWANIRFAHVGFGRKRLASLLVTSRTQHPIRMKPSDEDRALDEVAERLAKRFPRVPADTIVGLVQEHHRRFDGRPIRNFVPILIERAVKDQLRSQRTT
jgi:hypothetical protein